MLDRIRRALVGYQRKKLPVDDLTPAAVLVPLFRVDREVHLLMERRTDKVDKHKGQVSFPGGVCDPGDDSAVATALRETQEEVGIAPERVEVIGLLDDVMTITGFRITPVVARIPDRFEPQISEDEVDELLWVPWSLFLNEEGHQRSILEHDGQTFEVDFYPFQGHQIWGATARITRRLIELVENTTAPIEEGS